MNRDLQKAHELILKFRALLKPDSGASDSERATAQRQITKLKRKYKITNEKEKIFKEKTDDPEVWIWTPTLPEYLHKDSRIPQGCIIALIQFVTFVCLTSKDYKSYMVTARKAEMAYIQKVLPKIFETCCQNFKSYLDTRSRSSMPYSYSGSTFYMVMSTGNGSFDLRSADINFMSAFAQHATHLRQLHRVEDKSLVIVKNEEEEAKDLQEFTQDYLKKAKEDHERLAALGVEKSLTVQEPKKKRSKNKVVSLEDVQENEDESPTPAPELEPVMMNQGAQNAGKQAAVLLVSNKVLAPFSTSYKPKKSRSKKK